MRVDVGKKSTVVFSSLGLLALCCCLLTVWVFLFNLLVELRGLEVESSFELYGF